MSRLRSLLATLVLFAPVAAFAKAPTKPAAKPDAKPAAKTPDKAPAKPDPAQGSKGDAMDAVRQGNINFKKLLAKKAKPGSDEEKKLATELTNQMRGLFDIKDLARRALVDHAKEISDAQLDDLAGTLQSLVERAYLKQLRSNLKYDVSYDSQAPQGDSMLVKTTIKAEHKGKPASIEVDYLMHQADGHWTAYDVITDDVSMLRNYRAQFNKIIKAEKVDGLLAKMKKKLAQPDAT